MHNLSKQTDFVSNNSGKTWFGCRCRHYKDYREGGFGWVVAAAACGNEFIVFGNVKALGVLVNTITWEFDTSVWLTGWVVSLSFAVQYLWAPLVLPLIGKFGYRPVMLLAGVMTTTGYLLAAQAATNFIEWSIFIVAFAGVGSAHFIYPTISVLATYFKRYFASVLFISQAGMSFGTLIYGPLTQLLLNTYGWRGALTILGALTFHLVAVAAVAKPAQDQDENLVYERVLQDAEDDEDVSKRDNTGFWERFNLKVMKDVHFVLITVAGSVSGFCFVGWAVYVVPHGISQGLTPLQSSFLTTAFGLGNLVGKAISSVVVQRKLLSARWTMLLGSLIASCFFFIDPFMDSFLGLIIVSMVIGVGNGVIVTGKVILLRDISSDNKLLGMYSWSNLFLGLSSILAGFASGWFFEVTGSFLTTFIILGAVQFISVISLLCDIGVTSYRNE